MLACSSVISTVRCSIPQTIEARCMHKHIFLETLYGREVEWLGGPVVVAVKGFQKVFRLNRPKHHATTKSLDVNVSANQSWPDVAGVLLPAARVWTGACRPAGSHPGQPLLHHRHRLRHRPLPRLLLVERGLRPRRC